MDPMLKRVQGVCVKYSEWEEAGNEFLDIFYGFVARFSEPITALKP